MERIDDYDITEHEENEWVYDHTEDIYRIPVSCFDKYDNILVRFSSVRGANVQIDDGFIFTVPDCKNLWIVKIYGEIVGVLILSHFEEESVGLEATFTSICPAEEDELREKFSH